MKTKVEPTEVTKRLHESTRIGVQKGGSVVPRKQITQKLRWFHSGPGLGGTLRPWLLRRHKVHFIWNCGVWLDCLQVNVD